MGCRTIARLNTPALMEWPADPDPQKVYGVDAYISPDELAMHRIWQILSRPALTRLEHFSVGRLRILEVRLTDSSPAVGRTLDSVELPPHCRVVLVSRDEGVLIPHSEDVLLPRDRLLVLLSDVHELEELSESLGAPKEVTGEGNVKRLMIAGSTQVALRLAEQVAQRYDAVQIYLAEPDRARAEDASERLPDEVTVLVGSPTDRHFLREEGIRHEDLFVAATEREDLNMLSCLIAKREGARRTVALVYQTELEHVVQNTGVDTLINPKRVAVSAILNRATATEEIEALEVLQGGEAAIREFLVKADNGLVGKTIARLGLPEGSLAALINRNGEPLFPDEDEVLQGGDHLLVFTLKEQLPALEKLFR
jgi:trk system potassium uptake protein TrkA